MCERERKDVGTPELHKRLNITNNNGTSKNDCQNTLDYLYSKGRISDDQYYSGDQLLWAFNYSGLNTGAARMRYGEGAGSDSATQEYYELLYREAIMAVDPYERTIVKNVCCFSEWPDSRKFALLKRGLDDLTKYWKQHERHK